MLDLKAKLASAGLVSKEDIARVEKQSQRSKSKRRGPDGPRGGSQRGAKRNSGGKGTSPQAEVDKLVASLKDRPKGEIYDGIRRWVDRARLDPSSTIPAETSTVFHFPEESGKIGRLFLEADVIEKLRAGEAGVVAYMSNHGKAHAVMPVAAVRGIGRLFPEWVRMLHDGSATADDLEKAEHAGDDVASAEPSAAAQGDGGVTPTPAPMVDKAP